MKDDRPVRIPVYLCCRTARAASGAEIALTERRLVRQGREDRVIAVIAAPRGTRIRSREDRHGHDQLVVPLGRSLWSRLFGRRVAIPAKYVIGDARSGSYGLALVATRREAADEPSRTGPPAPAPRPEPAEVAG